MEQSNPIPAATKKLLESLKRMEEKTRSQLANKKLEVKRINALLERTSAEGRKTKLLRLLGAAEREVMQTEAWLNDVLGKMRAATEEEADAGR